MPTIARQIFPHSVKILGDKERAQSITRVCGSKQNVKEIQMESP